MIISNFLTPKQFLRTNYPEPDCDADRFSGCDKPDVFACKADPWRPARVAVVIPENLARLYQLNFAPGLDDRFRFVVARADTVTPEQMLEIVRRSNGLWIDLGCLTPEHREKTREIARALHLPLVNVSELPKREREVAQ